MAPRTITEGVWAFETEIRVTAGFYLPLRSTLLRLEGGALALVSPIRLSDDDAAEVDTLGTVEHLIAPNLWHHLFLRAACARWPTSKVWGPRALAKKRSDLRFDGVLEEAGRIGGALRVLPIEGIDKVGECALLHEPSRSLLLTDSVFNVSEPRAGLTSLILRFVGASRKLAMSRAERWMCDDRAKLAASSRAILDAGFDRLVPAHGDVIDSGAQPALEEAWAWSLAGGEATLRVALHVDCRARGLRLADRSRAARAPRRRSAARALAACVALAARRAVASGLRRGLRLRLGALLLRLRCALPARRPAHHRRDDLPPRSARARWRRLRVARLRGTGLEPGALPGARRLRLG
jgi:hypothetical protein